jgi:class 3 adenylate cyclase
MAAVRVDRWFAFVDLAGFTSFCDVNGDDESVRVLTTFRGAVRTIATDFGVRIAKWLGDGCMLVSVEAPQLVGAVCRLEQLIDDADMPLRMHAGMAGGPVILLEGDDYTGTSVNLASRLMGVAAPHEILTLPALGALAPPGTLVEPAGLLSVPGFHAPVEVVRLGCGAAIPRPR